MKRSTILALAFAVIGMGSFATRAQQIADPDFDPSVSRPAFTDRHPTVLFDEAHSNFHTAGGRYKAFADLITNDGYKVTPNRKKFSAETLKGFEILLIANAMGSPRMNDPDAGKSAFEPAECDAVRDWVKSGGALLLIADHHPWGAAAEDLGARFGVQMGKKTTFDPPNAEPGLSPAALVFTHANGLLGEHPIVRGRDELELVDRVVSFTGQSLSVPKGSAILMKLSETAMDRPAPAQGQGGGPSPAAGRAQGLALTFEKGRVVILGEAGMLSAQLAGPAQRPLGMNLPGSDNKQFGLNIMHWLSAIPFTKPTPAPAIAATSKAKSAATPKSAGAMAAVTRPEPPRSTGKPMSIAEIVAESEPSIALIKGQRGMGTGFLVKPGIVCTNAHVVDDEFVSAIEVRFPSAAKENQGPLSVELLYEDAARDLAFLKVETNLPPLRLARSYTFHKGEDVTVIGNPGVGGELVLENAIARGIMSTKTTIEGQKYYQLSIAINPGNSGGPVFSSTGDVIGVAARKSSAQEALAFSVPVEDVNAALSKLASQASSVGDRTRGRHRTITAVHALGSVGALYCIGLDLRRAAVKPDAQARTIKLASQTVDAAITEFNKAFGASIGTEVQAARGDASQTAILRDKFSQLASRYDGLKTAYRNPPSQLTDAAVKQMKAQFLTILKDICKSLKIDQPPDEILSALGDNSAAQHGILVVVPSRPPLRERPPQRKAARPRPPGN